MARDAKGRFTKGSGGSSSGGGEIHWVENKLLANIDDFDNKIDRLMTAATELHATRAEAYARANAPWNDQTSNARNGLKAVAVHERHKHAIVVHHSVDYGIWLEVRWEGRYAIIDPTIRHEGVEVMRTVGALLATMR